MNDEIANPAPRAAHEVIPVSDAVCSVNRTGEVCVLVDEIKSNPPIFALLRGRLLTLSTQSGPITYSLATEAAAHIMRNKSVLVIELSEQGQPVRHHTLEVIFLANRTEG